MTPPPRSTESIFQELIQEVATAAASWNPPLPSEPDQWDPYVRAILRAVAYESAALDAGLAAVPDRIWRQLGLRLRPDLLRPVPARTILQFSPGRAAYLVDCRREFFTLRERFRPERDLTVLPLSWLGQEGRPPLIEGSSLFLGLRLPEGDSSFAQFFAETDKPRLGVFLNSGSDRDPDLPLVFEATDVACFDGVAFSPAGRFRRRVTAALPTGDEARFFDLEPPRDWRSADFRQGGSGLWLRLTFPGPVPQVFTRSPPPLTLNCVPAVNVWREHHQVPLRGVEAGARVGYLRLDSPSDGATLFEVEDVRVGDQIFLPTYKATTIREARYHLDWTEAAGRVGHDLVLIHPGRLRADDVAHLDLLFTRSDSWPPGRQAPGRLEGTDLLETRQGLITIRNVVPIRPGMPPPVVDEALIEGLGLQLRTRNRLVTAVDYEQFLRAIDRRVARVTVTPRLQSAASGVWEQVLAVAVGLSAAVSEWELGAVAEYFQRELQHRSTAAVRVVVTCHREVGP